MTKHPYEESQLERGERGIKTAKALLAMSQTEGWQIINDTVSRAIERNKERLCDLKCDAEVTKTLRIEIGFKQWLLSYVNQATPEKIDEEEKRLAPLREMAQQRQDSGIP